MFQLKRSNNLNIFWTKFLLENVCPCLPLFAQLWASLGVLTAGCLPAVRCGQFRLRAEERAEKLLLHSAQLLSSTPCNGGNCLSTRGPLIRARSSVQCRMSDMRPSESLLSSECCWHRDSHINSLNLISIHCIQTRLWCWTIVCLDIHASNIKLKSNLYWQINLE